MTTPARLLTAIAVATLLAACGNKGPLMRPSQIPPKPATAPALPLPAPVEPATQTDTATPATDESESTAVPVEDGADSGD